MIKLLAAEGGYQAFHLGGVDKTWLYICLVAGVVGIGAGLLLARNVLAADQGTPKMKEIALAVQEGAQAFLARQFRAIVMIIVPLAILIFFTATKVVKPDGGIALTFQQDGIYRVICFLFGAAFSGLTGFIGMSIAVRGNVRTAAAASHGGGMAAALRVAFRTGAVTGMLCVGLGLAGATAIVLIFQNSATAVLIGFAFGASLLALFMRVGGGIFTKAADVGADLVGKVEAGIPEDDPRNAATIADNVGDNVGDCAGMAADLFESYEITIISSLILGYSAFGSIHLNPTPAVLYPLIVPAIGIFASLIGVLVVRARQGDRNALAPINRGFWLAALLTVVGAFLVAQYYVHDLKVFWAVLDGRRPLTRAQPDHRAVHLDRTRAGQGDRGVGPHRAGDNRAVGLLDRPGVVGLGHRGHRDRPRGGHRVGEQQHRAHLLLDRADRHRPAGHGRDGRVGGQLRPGVGQRGGNRRDVGEFTGEAERVMVSLDAVGNTTKAITKGVAIGSAVIAAVALFAAFIETINSQLNLHLRANQLLVSPFTQINVSNPKTFIGLLIGGSIGFLFSSLAIRAVGRSAGTVVLEVRRQFREHPGIMDYTEKPEYGRVISICTAAAQRELATPALLAILSPVIIGFGINYFALGAFLAGTILTGQLLANTLSNSGGAWDNAKKYIEDGNEGGKGSEAHKAAVIGDTVGDPFKDTAGPALNPMIKVMNLVSLLILPAVISLRNDTGARLAIAGVSLVILLGALAFSKRGAEAMDAESADSTPAPAAVASVD